MEKNNDTIPVHHPSSRTEFNQLNEELYKRRFVTLDALKMGMVHTLPLGDKDPSEKDATSMASCMGGGALSTGPLSKVAWGFDSRNTTPTAVSGGDGKLLGRGYIPWGPGDNLPSVVYALAKALPYTASPLRYLADLATGLGPRLMYRFHDGSMCEYRDAGHRLLKEWEEIQEGETPGIVDGFIADYPDYKEPEKKHMGESPKLKRAREAYEEWERTWMGYDVNDEQGDVVHIPGAKEFLEDNDISLHCSQCMQDDVMFDMYFPTVGLERGRNKKWDPKIVRVDILPIISGVRYEAMNEYRHIQNLYFSDHWRTKGMTNIDAVSAAAKKIAMYPVAMPQGRVSELRYQVDSHKRGRIKDRPTWIVCPVYYGNKPYYQQPAWWSIFLSKFYDFASTIAYDKAKQRENKTSWGRIMYISLDYLDQVFANDGYQGNPEKQQQFIGELEQSMENFLQHRENHGKFMRQWMWLGQDGKEHHNVEIVNIADAVKDEASAGKEELMLATSPIFLALGVDPRLVGVPMAQASNGGTALREMHLLKQQQMNVKQRAYERFLNSVASFNGWSNAEWRIKQQTLTTLDNSKTGTVETISGEGA